MSHLDFHFAGNGIRVDAPSQLLDWLEEFLAPQVPVSRGVQPDHSVRFVIDAREHERLIARGPHDAGGRVECFTLDAGIHSGPRWNDSADTLTAFDEKARVFYRRRSDRSNIVEGIGAEDVPGVRVALMRMVREFAMNYARRAGWLIVHGAAVQLGDNAVVISGPKGSGKSTVLLHALLHEGGAYISNDRIAIRFEDGQAFVQGIPTIISVRQQSGVLLPSIAATLGGGQYHFARLLEECSRAASQADTSQIEKWHLSSRQLCHALSVESLAGAPLSALVFPEVDGRVGSVALDDLSGGDVLAALTRSVLRPSPGTGMFSLDEWSDVDGVDTPMLMQARLASLVPGFVCRLGPDAYASGARWLGPLTTPSAAET
jgi:hypothetical protein